MSTPREAAFLDRDGTLVRDVGYARSPDQLFLLPGALEGLSELARAGFALVIVTNQSGIGRGYLSEDDYQLQIKKMADLAAGTAQFAGHYYCPHHPTEASGAYRVECECRKPKPGLYIRAARDLNIDLTRSLAIGDAERDLAGARAAGIHVAVRVGAAQTPDFLAAARLAIVMIRKMHK